MAELTQEILVALHHAIHRDSSVRARLFGLSDASEFIIAIQQLAKSLGYELAENDLLQLMNAGQRAWLERRLP